MGQRLSAIISGVPEIIAAATLEVETRGQGFTEITHDAARFLSQAGAKDGSLLFFMRHTSASLIIQENADSDVRADLATALARIAPEDAGWLHNVEGPDDMPAHVKTMFTGVSLQVPVKAGACARDLAGSLRGRASCSGTSPTSSAPVSGQPPLTGSSNCALLRGIHAQQCCSSSAFAAGCSQPREKGSAPS